MSCPPHRPKCREVSKPPLLLARLLGCLIVLPPTQHPVCLKVSWPRICKRVRQLVNECLGLHLNLKSQRFDQNPGLLLEVSRFPHFLTSQSACGLVVQTLHSLVCRQLSQRPSLIECQVIYQPVSRPLHCRCVTKSISHCLLYRLRIRFVMFLVSPLC